MRRARVSAWRRGGRDHARRPPSSGRGPRGPGPSAVDRELRHARVPARRSRSATRGERSHRATRRHAACRPARATATASRRARATSAIGHVHDRAAPTATAPVRFAFTGDADATPARTARRRSIASRSTRRMAAEGNHFNVNLGDTIYSDSEVGGRAGRAHGRREMGEVPARARAAGAPAASRRGRPLQPLGRPRVHQRLLAAGARRGDLPRRREGVPRLRARRHSAATRPLPQRSAGASTSSSSSSTSARSGARRRRRVRAATSRRPRRRPSATPSPARARRSHSPVAPACLDAIRSDADDARRRQLAAFTAAIRASTATFKVS